MVRPTPKPKSAPTAHRGAAQRLILGGTSAYGLVRPHDDSSPHSQTAPSSSRSEKTLGNPGHQRWVWDAVYSADSAYLITASSDQTARLWDVRRCVRYTLHPLHVASVMASSP